MILVDVESVLQAEVLLVKPLSQGRVLMNCKDSSRDIYLIR
jgi:hypothetical protein